MTTTTREFRFQSTRFGVTKKVVINDYTIGYEMYVTVNIDEDRTPREVFVKVSKQGSVISGLVNALAVTISMALQHGVPWGILREKYLGTRFEPRDVDQGYTSIVDAIAKAIDEACVEALL